MGKSLVASKTFWLNIIALIITVLGDITNTFTLNAKTLAVIAIVLPILNMLVRIFGTSQPITSVLPKPNPPTS